MDAGERHEPEQSGAGEAPPRFPTRLVLGALVGATVWLGWLAVSTWGRAARIADETEVIQRLSALRGTILLEDEALTMSARLGAATGEARWEARYEEHEPRLAAALAEAQRLLADDPEGRIAAERTDAANVHLLAMERAAFARARAGDSAGAWRLLTDAAYEREKAEYSAGMHVLAGLVGRQVAAARARSDELARASALAVGGHLLVLAAAALVVGRAVWSWRRLLLDRAEALRREVAERARAEQALAASEQRFRSVIQDSPDAVISCDPAGRVCYWNRGAELLLGWSAEEAQGLPVQRLVTPWQRGQLRLGLRRLRRGQPAGPVDQPLALSARPRAGGEVPVELTLSTWRAEGDVIVTALVRNLTGRRQLERAAREAGLEAQRRIGRDLHDGPAQQLVAASYRAQALIERARAGERPGPDELDELVRLLARTLDWTRTIAHGLAPIGLDADDLSGALSALARDTAAVFGLRCSYEPPGEPLRLERTVAEHLHGIAREAVMNAVKHAGASSLTLSLARVGGRVQVRVEDDGGGLPSGGVETPPGLGLSLMRHRADAIGGAVEVAPRPGGGTVVQASCPLIEVEREGEPARA